MAVTLTTDQLEQAYADIINGVPPFAVPRKRGWELTPIQLRQQMLTHYTEQQLADARTPAANQAIQGSQLYRIEFQLRRMTRSLAIEDLDEFKEILQNVIFCVDERLAE